MGRTLGISLLFIALATVAIAQNSTYVITATPVPATSSAGQPMSGALPLPAPPEVALPGSGTPVGIAPQMGVNDARTGGTGALIQLGVGDVQIGGQPLLPTPVQVVTPQAAAENIPTAQASPSIGEAPQSESTPSENAGTMPTAPTNTQEFRSPLSLTAGTRPMSLGEFATQLKLKSPLNKRVFDNSDILALNTRAPRGLRSASEDLPQSDQPAEPAPAKKDSPRALDQNDLKKVQDALQRSKNKQDQNNPK